MRTPLGLLLAGTLALVLGACAAVTVPEPMGIEIPDLKELELAGKWKNPDGDVMDLVVTDPAKGIVEMISEESDNEGNTKEEKVIGYLRKSGDWLFISIGEEAGKMVGKRKPARYLWGRLEIEDGYAVVWAPDVEKFQKLVEAGTLPGKVRKSKSKDDDSVAEVRLGKLTPAHLKAIVDETHGVLLEWDRPLILTKVK